jgi:ABC-2 type transport system ATP-binding protein
MNMMAAALQFESLSREYRELLGRRTVRALDGLSLSVEAGEIFGFLGANGAGKTTALHIAMGLLRPTSGGGWMLGKPFGDAPTRSRVGFLAENVALYHRPAGRLVRFYGALNGMRDPELAIRTRAVLEAVELSGDAERNVGKFSRGMLQRVGLAQALVHDPELLILDEPTSALDPLGRIAVRELLVRARAQGKTIFLSSHLLSEVEMICDRVAILRHGKLARLGKTAELLESSQQTEIMARGIDPAKFDGVAANGVVKLQVPASGQRAAIERVWAAGGEIVSVNPARRSLEEIFVELTKDKTSDPLSASSN